MCQHPSGRNASDYGSAIIKGRVRVIQTLHLAAIRAQHAFVPVHRWSPDQTPRPGRTSDLLSGPGRSGPGQMEPMNGLGSQAAADPDAYMVPAARFVIWYQRQGLLCRLRELAPRDFGLSIVSAPASGPSRPGRGRKCCLIHSNITQ